MKSRFSELLDADVKDVFVLSMVMVSSRVGDYVPEQYEQDVIMLVGFLFFAAYQMAVRFGHVPTEDGEDVHPVDYVAVDRRAGLRGE